MQKSNIERKDALAMLVDGKPYDLSHTTKDKAEVKSLTFDDEEGQKIYWHSTSHILAQAVKHLFPDVKLAIGPAIENGFYYDFDSSHNFTPEDLIEIEKEMRKIISADYKFERKEVNKEAATKHFSSLNENYKLEILNELDGNISIYTDGDFTDLCQGPHIPSTGKIKAFKLLKAAGAYWRGDEHNPMLQRIYGTSFPSQEQLEAELKRIEEAKLIDHRKLGKTLELFSIFEEAGPGLVSWLPNGNIIRNAIEEFWKREHRKRGYQLVTTPHIAKANLWHKSGHFKFYEHMTTMEFGGDNYVLKPMNCIFHMLIYSSKIHSYKELPIRYAELGTVYRYEKSGVLHGLLRPRGFTQDDAHIFCRRDQVITEITGVLELAEYMMKTFGFVEYQVDLSARDPANMTKYAGSVEDWDLAESTLAQVLEAKAIKYKRVEGEAAFYGPKIDIKIIDILGRPWQGPTIQFDFNLPIIFNLTYMGEDNKSYPVFVVHRTVLGSLERFIGCLIEHYKGAFPYWLSPVQVVVATVSEGSMEYATSVYNALISNGVRAELNVSPEKIGAKIRLASLNKVPYILIIGNKEVTEQTVAVRERKKGDIGAFKLEEFIGLLNKENVS